MNKSNQSNPSINLSLTIKYHETYRNLLTEDLSFNKTFSFERSQFEEINKSAIDKYIKKNTVDRNIPKVIR